MLPPLIFSPQDPQSVTSRAAFIGGIKVLIIPPFRQRSANTPRTVTVMTPLPMLIGVSTASALSNAPGGRSRVGAVGRRHSLGDFEQRAQFPVCGFRELPGDAVQLVHRIPARRLKVPFRVGVCECDVAKCQLIAAGFGHRVYCRSPTVSRSR